MAPEARSDVETISLRVVYLRIISSFSRQTISKYCAVAESFRLRPVRSRAQSVCARGRSFREYFALECGNKTLSALNEACMNKNSKFTVRFRPIKEEIVS